MSIADKETEREEGHGGGGEGGKKKGLESEKQRFLWTKKREIADNHTLLGSL